MHTPGPWVVREEKQQQMQIGDYHYEHDVFFVDVDGWTAMAVVATSGGHVDDESRANASLIAAAPGLLAALREMQSACACAMRVIAKHDPDDSMTLEFIEELKRANVANGVGVRADAAIAKAEGR